MLTCKIEKSWLVMLAITVAVFAAGAVSAQDYFSPLFAAYTAHRVNEVPPCIHRAVIPVVFDKTLLVMYDCLDGHPVFYRYFRADGYVGLDNPPAPLPTNPGITAELPTAACPPGFVTGIYGGCVPPDHPLARPGGR